MPPRTSSFVESDSVAQDPIPSFLRERLGRERAMPFSETKEDSFFAAVVKSFDTRKEGPPRRLSWTPDTFSLENLSKVLNNKKRDYELYQQRFIPERHEQLGNEIGAAHFIVFRGGAVKFYGVNKWIKAKETNSVDYADELPKKFVPDVYLEAVDLSNMNIYYEGLDNLHNLSRIKYASFSNCERFDDWCLDKISNEFRETLEYLDISNCHKISYRGLSALCKIKNLSVLVVENISDSYEFQLTCLMLEDVFPNLKIKGVTYIDFDNNTEVVNNSTSNDVKIKKKI